MKSKILLDWLERYAPKAKLAVENILIEEFDDEDLRMLKIALTLDDKVNVVYKSRPLQSEYIASAAHGALGNNEEHRIWISALRNPTLLDIFQSFDRATEWKLLNDLHESHRSLLLESDRLVSRGLNPSKLPDNDILWLYACAISTDKNFVETLREDVMNIFAPEKFFFVKPWTLAFGNNYPTFNKEQILLLYFLREIAHENLTTIALTDRIDANSVADDATESNELILLTLTKNLLKGTEILPNTDFINLEAPFFFSSPEIKDFENERLYRSRYEFLPRFDRFIKRLLRRFFIVLDYAQFAMDRSDNNIGTITPNANEIARLANRRLSPSDLILNAVLARATIKGVNFAIPDEYYYLKIDWSCPPGNHLWLETLAPQRYGNRLRARSARLPRIGQMALLITADTQFRLRARPKRNWLPFGNVRSAPIDIFIKRPPNFEPPKIEFEPFQTEFVPLPENERIRGIDYGFANQKTEFKNLGDKERINGKHLKYTKMPVIKSWQLRLSDLLFKHLTSE